jgi:hypothetical protein
MRQSIQHGLEVPYGTKFDWNIYPGNVVSSAEGVFNMICMTKELDWQETHCQLNGEFDNAQIDCISTPNKVARQEFFALAAGRCMETLPNIIVCPAY